MPTDCSALFRTKLGRLMHITPRWRHRDKTYLFDGTEEFVGREYYVGTIKNDKGEAVPDNSIANTEKAIQGYQFQR